MKEKVDFVVFEDIANDKVLFLVKGKMLIVLRELTELLDETLIHIDLKDQSDADRKVLSKVC